MTNNFSSPKTESTDVALIEGLKQIGLAQNEAEIYIHLLKIGRETSASKIAQATDIHRQNAYVALGKLIQSGLVLSIENGARYRYRALPPGAVERYARRRFDAASTIVQQLATISTLENEQSFETYVGDTHVRNFEIGFTEQLQEDETQYVISGASKNFVSFFADEYASLAAEWKRKRLRTLYIGGAHETESLTYAQSLNQNFEYRILPNMPDGVTSTVVRHDSVVLYSLAKPPLVYVIKSDKISAEYKAYFDVLWGMAKTVA